MTLKEAMDLVEEAVSNELDNIREDPDEDLQKLADNTENAWDMIVKELKGRSSQ